ncbi:cytochrome P450 [Mycena epipterygia]|nr:cytochrome P450 [Mycena epipterygia]
MFLWLTKQSTLLHAAQAVIPERFLVDLTPMLKYVLDWLAGAGFKRKAKDAGFETTVAALCTFVLIMLATPEAQQKAQTEIDAIIGQEQLPEFNDEQSLPYVSAQVKRVLRWKPVVAIGIHHKRSGDRSAVPLPLY